jgi:hypothetical protein
MQGLHAALAFKPSDEGLLALANTSIEPRLKGQPQDNAVKGA